MTEEQIIKTLEDAVVCIGEAPFIEKAHKGNQLKSSIIDLINRKNAVIESLRKEVYDLCGGIVDLKADLKTAKSEAYKEFEEKFKEKASSAITSCQGYEIYETKQYQISAVGLDNLLKELTEGGNEDE